MLMVVDDIDVTKNLAALQLFIDKDITNVNCKSRILVNYRNWKILKNHINEVGKVDMKSLEKKQAREFFMFHAIGNENHVTTKDFENTSMEIIKACWGLP
jgi:ribosomal protein S18